MDILLTPEIVDRDFPLQAPGGIARKIKEKLETGELEEADFMYRNLRAIDQAVTEQIADELVVRHELPHSISDLNVLRALRLGIAAGMQRGRQEGSEVVNEILGQGE